MKKYAFESFAPEFLMLLGAREETGFLVSLIEPSEKQRKSMQKALEEAEDDPIWFLQDEELLIRALKSRTPNLTAYLERYWKVAEDFYNFYEHEYHRFGPNTRLNLNVFSPLSLYLCWKYYGSVGDKEKSKSAFFYMICQMTCYGFEAEWLPFIKDDFDLVKDFFCADWLTVHPIMTWQIGRYYIDAREYAKARKFFKLGASLDYDGRQSMEPYIEVGKNKYELGMLYYKGLGVKQNYAKARAYFDNAAEDAGEHSLPIIGDMYYEGLGVKQDYGEALECYCGYNRFNLDLSVYYKEMSDIQRERLYELLDRRGQRPDLSFDQITRIRDIYAERLEDEEKAAEYEQKALQIALATPIENRSEDMDVVYVRNALAKLKEEASLPTEPTGGIPADLKEGDVFTFGRFNGEPIEWKALEKYDDGTMYVITTKIIVKMNYATAVDWLNTDFLEVAFTEDEKARIEEHDYRQFRDGSTYIYLPSQEQLEQFEGTYPKGTIQQTEFAKSLSRNDDVMCCGDEVIKSDGSKARIITQGAVRGVRPAMDVYLETE